MQTRLFARSALLAAALAATLLALPALPAGADTDNPTTGSAGYSVQTWHVDNQLTATVANKATWNLPWASRLIDIKCSARALGGTSSPTYTWTLQSDDGTEVTVATCAMVTAGVEAQGTITAANQNVADEAVMTLDYASTGTSPTADDVTVILIWKRQ